MKKKYEEMTIKSDLRNLVSVQNLIEGICDHYNIPNHFGQLSVAIDEAVTNAIVHGNKSDSTKKVSIKVCKTSGGISFRITDEGNGFDTKKYSENDLNDATIQGNGVFLMKALSNRLAFFDEGRSIELFFNIDGISSSKALERKTLMDKYLTKEGVFARQQEMK